MDTLLTRYPFASLSFNLPNSKLQSLAFNNHSFNPVFSCNCSKKHKISDLLINSSNKKNPNLKWRTYSSSVRPASVLVPIVKKVKAFALEASKSKWVWVSAFCSRRENFYSGGEIEGKCLQNGSFGMALLSVTSTAKVKISPFVATLAANPTFVSGLFAGVIAQFVKVLLNFWVERKWDFRLFLASGGMPSSHSAICTALTTSVALCHGVADSLFPVCLGFSSIVMYDAIGVRRHAGMQAEVLNVIIEDLFQGHPISQRKLKELLGHTPSQVIAGALLGIIVACFCCQSCTIAG